MKKLKTRNEYVGCNNNCRFYADKIEAYSYKHWCFVKKIKGKVVFNNYKYSQTTKRHQITIKRLLNRLNINVDFFVESKDSLDKCGFWRDALLKSYNKAIRAILKNNTKGTRKSTKLVNTILIEEAKKEIKDLKELGSSMDFRWILKQYRFFKSNHTNELLTLKTFREYRGKIITIRGTQNRWIILKKLPRSLVLKSLKDSKHIFSIHISDFLKRVRICKLSNVLENQNVEKLT